MKGPTTITKVGLHPTIEEIEATPIAGNAFNDMQIIQGLDRIIIDESETMEARIFAYDFLANKVLGLDTPSTEEKVLEFTQLSRRE